MSSTTLHWFKSSYSGSDGGKCIEVAYEWRTSSHSGPDGGNCVEVGYDWTKSSHSGSNGGACVEVSACSCSDAPVHVRDSKNPTGPTLTFPRPAWSAFLSFAATFPPES
jgi:hypothetical protein